MKKLLVMQLALVPVFGFAEVVEVNGIYYDIVKTAKQAAVTENVNGYSGDIVIPSTIMVDRVEYSVTSIGAQAFNFCSSLTSIELPSTITSIGNAAFDGCRKLSAIEIPSGVTSIESYAFNYCSSLSSIELPSTITSIGSSAFSECSKLSAIEIPSGVTSIESYAFNYCSSLSEIEIPSSVTSIEDGAFSGCRSLNTIEIPASVTNIGSKVFANCISLMDVYYYATELPTSSYTDLFYNTFIEDATLHVPSAVIEDFAATEPWSKFGEIVPTDNEDIPQCEAPTISYQAGKLKFACATDGAQIHYEIDGTQASSGSIQGGEVAVSTHITVTAYATAIGYLRSETVEYQLPFNSGLRGDVNQDGEVNVADAIEVANIILEKE